MIKKVFFFFFSLISLCFYSSCKHEDESPIDLGYEYFPVNVGHWVVYDVDSTYYYDFSDTVINFHYQVKEKIESVFLDNQNMVTQRVERYKRYDSSDWYLVDVWTTNISASSAVRTEDNIQFIKLIFPVISNKSWNGNALNYMNSVGYPDYKYSNVFDPYDANGVNFDSTVTVIQNTESIPFINENNQIEVYAKNIGMIYKRYKQLNFTFNYQTQDTLIKGADYTYKIIDFGNY